MKKNTFKSVLVLVMALLMTLSVFTGCQKKVDENGNEIIDKGAEINMYISSFPYDLDPGRIQYDADLNKFFSLIYEPLFTIDENGKLEGALVKSWECEKDERDGKLKLQLKIKSTSWSDGVAVDSDDVTYAFKRILSPSNTNPAASALFPIENARDAKAGMVTVDDVGFSAINSTTVEIVFEKEFTDVEYFLRSLASPVFTPLREDIVTQYGDDWAQPLSLKEQRYGDEAYSSIVTNGPFVVKEWLCNKNKPTSVLLERSSSYYRNLHVEQDYDTYVKPYRIMINFRDDADKQIENYKLKKDLNRVFLIGEFSKEGFDANKKKIDSYANGSAYTYFFNTNNVLLSDARVRKALSIALDRKEIAEIVGKGVVPATGFVPTGIEADAKGKKDYRKVADAVISTTANIEEAKALLKEAKSNGGAFTITISAESAWENEVAKYAQGVWKQLGFTVSVNKVSTLSDKENKVSEFERNIASGNFDVIGFDLCAFTSDAYSFLVPFATQYSGSIVPIDDEIEDGKLPSTAHFTGFSDAEYDALIGEISYDIKSNESALESGVLAAKKASERLEIYKQAEAMLAEKAPCAPLFFGVNNYMISGKLSGVEFNNLANPVFTETELSGYKNFKISGTIN